MTTPTRRFESDTTIAILNLDQGEATLLLSPKDGTTGKFTARPADRYDYFVDTLTRLGYTEAEAEPALAIAGEAAHLDGREFDWSHGGRNRG